jgi:hypothetical protein
MGQGPEPGEVSLPDLCGERPFPDLSGCLLGKGHKGKHVFCRGQRDGSGGMSGVTFYEQRRTSFHAVMRADLKPGERLSMLEAAALYMTMRVLADKAPPENGGT